MEADPQRYPIIPMPQTIRALPGSFNLDRPVTVSVGTGASAAYDMLRNELTGSALSHDGATVVIAVEPDPGRPEGYHLTITPDIVRLVGSDAAGAVHGAQTVRQLLAASGQQGRRSLPCCHIEDAPRLRWRGLMLDVARHYMPVSFIRRLIQLIAFHKLNVLHLHLTDDQGWRVEIPGYPLLTEIGAWRAETLIGHHRSPGGSRYDGVRHGGFYTEQELRDIVAYASEHAIRVVPEIDMPGHVQAALAAYPRLGSGEPAEVARGWGVSSRILTVDDTSMGFCKDVLSHVLDIFPSEFVHCGGDEVVTEEWRLGPRMHDRALALGLADVTGLHHWFTTQIAAYLAERGRRYVGWDEILDYGPVTPGSVVMAWRDHQRAVAAARAGTDAVMSPRSHVYFDHYQGDPTTEPLAYGGNTPLERVYEFQPLPPDLGDAADHILGAEAQLWTEYVATVSHAEYMLFPRLCAFAEAAWNPAYTARAEYSAFLTRLRRHLNTLADWGVNYRPLDGR